MIVSLERVLELLDYNPKTGIFAWKQGTKTRYAGQRAGTPDKHGYIVICIDRKQYKAHRLAWLITYGVWPEGEIDHKRNDSGDNRIKYLRESTRSQNSQNVDIPITNTSGFKGAFWHKTRKRWYSKVRCDGVIYFLGYFDTAELAHAAYCVAIARLHGEFARVA